MVEDIKQCRSCGSDIKAGSDFCPACGRELSGIGDKTGAGSKSKAFDYIFITGFIFIFAVIFFIGKGQQAVGGQPSDESMNRAESMNILNEMMANLPQDYKGLIEKGNSLMDNHHYPVAAECYRRALAIDFGDPNIICDLGSCLHATNDFEGAIEMFEKALRLDSSHAIAHFNLGIVYRGMDSFPLHPHW